MSIGKVKELTMIRSYKTKKNIRAKKIRGLKRYVRNFRARSNESINYFSKLSFEGTINVINHQHLDFHGFGDLNLKFRKKHWKEYVYILTELNKKNISNVQCFVLISKNGGSYEDAIYVSNDPIMKYNCIKSKYEDFFIEAFKEYGLNINVDFKIGYCSDIEQDVIEMFGKSIPCIESII